jgi:ribose transport system substrate-binding protein
LPPRSPPGARPRPAEVVLAVLLAVQPGKVYQIYGSISYANNDFRQAMIRASQVLSSQYPPLKGHVQLTEVVAPQNTVLSQVQSLQQIIARKPAAIVIDAASPTGLNPVISTACKAGIVVVSFDATVTAPCAWIVSGNNNLIGEAWANWMIQTMHGKGNVFLDSGISGESASEGWYNQFKQIAAKYPGIHIVCQFQGQATYATELQGISQCLSSNPNVQGILDQGTGVSAPDAMAKAGIKTPIAFTGGAYNNAAEACLKDHDQCLLAEYPIWIQALAEKYALAILQGKYGSKPRSFLQNWPFVQSNIGTVKLSIPGFQAEPVKEGTTYLPDAPPTLILPVAPPWAPDATQAILNSFK